MQRRTHVFRDLSRARFASYLSGLDWPAFYRDALRELRAKLKKDKARHPDVFGAVAKRAPRGMLAPACARLVSRRLDEVEAWIVLAGYTDAITGRTVRDTLAAWMRLRRAVCPEHDPTQEGVEKCEASVGAPVPMCKLDGKLVPIGELPDSHGLAVPQAPGNGAKGARTVNGRAAPPPEAVLIQGVGAVSRQKLLGMVGRDNELEEDGPGFEWKDVGKHARKYAGGHEE